LRIMASRHRSDQTVLAEPESEADELTAELAASYWQAHDKRLAETGFGSIARQLPGLIGQAIRLGWEANRRDTVATIGLNLVSGILTGFALLATTGVLEALFAAGPTPQRVRAALPSLVLVAAAVAARGGLQAAAGWAQSRLHPQVDRVVEIRLLDLTTRVELAAFDDAEFYDAMQRARDRGLYSASQVVTNVLDCVTGAAGIASAALVVAVLQPILLVLLLAAELPGGWAAIRAARIGYITNFALADSHRRKWILSDLMAERRTAAEMRSFTLRHFMLARVARLAAYARDAQMKAASRQAMTRVTAQVAGGDADPAALTQAAVASGADTVIEKLPHGYDTLLDRHFKDGAELSGGQWQRIAAARGFYRSARLLIMDEPAAALDARAEYALFSSIRGYAAGRAVLLITHRLASVKHADRIYVLRDGRVIEQGGHADLLALGGQYAELFTLQASQYEV
jgi:ABC-type branched-subunit amino acid transport system ATPase component